MASIEKRISKSGERTYHITVCAGYGLDGKKIRRRTTYKPDANMSDKQADKAAQKEAFRFEQQLEQAMSWKIISGSRSTQSMCWS